MPDKFKPPLISEVITSLIELQSIIGDQPVTLAQYTEDEADVPLPDVKGLGVKIRQGGNGEVKWEE